MGSKAAKEKWMDKKPDPLEYLIPAYDQLYSEYAAERAINTVANVVNGVIRGVSGGTISIKDSNDFIDIINENNELRLAYYQNVIQNNVGRDFGEMFPGHTYFPRISTDKHLNYKFDISNPFINIRNETR